MQRTMLKSKIHKATVTDANAEYEGSMTIAEDIMEAADIIENEKIQVVNITNGSRLETYAIKGRRGSGQMIVNGAAAKVMNKGDIVIVLTYMLLPDQEAKESVPRIVRLDKNNNIISFVTSDVV